MVLLTKINEEAIVENLKKRLNANAMFTYIGPVLISVNPFKEMPYFTEKEMEIYQGAAQYENPPHIYAVAENMFRNMLIDNENQCAIISGESGAGKTVNAKFIMNYIARMSGGGQRVQHVKDVILQSNPLLEAFGNSATVRNWNSSRFGKYVEIVFSRGGEPIGGKISNFLLEKSRVVHQNLGERNFHIFYQMCRGADNNMKRTLLSFYGLWALDQYNYLNHSGCYDAQGTDDVNEYKQTMHAMGVVGIPPEVQREILNIIAAMLHIGNIKFVESKNYAAVSDTLEYPALLLGLKPGEINEKLVSRHMESRWGQETEEIDVRLNVEQAEFTRDAWVKDLYVRLFEYLINSVNDEMKVTTRYSGLPLSIGILDIYGFEIFDVNGFEQFCINFVNEKLQQVFIELTLKAEQEEYVSEGIVWTPIDYFNNKIVCDLIEAKKPPGIMCILNDICSQIHGQSEGVDNQFLSRLSQLLSTHQHLHIGPDCFVVRHYAGDVTYHADGFCEKNRDVFYQDFIPLMQSSQKPYIKSLFPETISSGAKSIPTSFASKIKAQANGLIDSLMRCAPHYIRCIKPNETKRPNDWESKRVLHQVQYLGLKENIRVRRAGFAYRRRFEQFLFRYALLSEQTWPKFNGDPKEGCKIVCRAANLESDQYQMGLNKIFVKNPESLFLLEELRERKYDAYARIIQKAFKRFIARKKYSKKKEEASDLLFNHKERRRYSINRGFVGDYIGLEYAPALQMLAGKKERVLFAATVDKYDRRFKVSKLDLLVTGKAIMLIGRELVKKGKDKGKLVEVVKRDLGYAEIESISLSPFQDNFLAIAVRDSHTSLLETPLKTEFITAASKKYKDVMNGAVLPIEFRSSFTIILKKSRFGGGTRNVMFSQEPGIGDATKTTSKGKTLHVSVGPGLPNTTRPSSHAPDGGTKTSQNGAVRSHQSKVSLFTKTIFGNFTSRLLEKLQIRPKRPAPLPRPPLKPKPVPLVEALYSYDAQDTDELSFVVGDKFELIDKDPSGWWRGKIKNRTGLFPGNYVKEIGKYCCSVQN
ncbi:unnamed protein product [Enterobius vermicularis]|uniref:Unconventional myosin-Ie n=1 Tax=Enterobius vermicularis TaxID=51028 RepID=A0A0N4VDN5_ENTVE|nr:unnamed protein product [Enterobius vermicularis]